MKIKTHAYCLDTVVTESLKMLGHVLSCLRAEKSDGLKEAKHAIHTLKGNFAYFDHKDILIEIVQLESYFAEILAADFSLTERFSAIEKIHDLFWKLALLNPSEDLSECHSGNDFYLTGKAMVEDLAQKLDKKISFTIKGGEHPLPGKGWDEIFTYFTHFLRNAADHGLESVDERLQKGKSAQGSIEIEFFHKMDSVEIHLRDDGRGVDWKAIAPSEKEAFKKLFEDGYSTRKIITSESGMGIGLSALNSLMTHRLGRLGYVNEPGKGLTLVMIIPVTPDEIREVA